MNDRSLKLLEKALAAQPADWETRAYLMDEYLAAGHAQQAADLLNAAPEIPEAEPEQLRVARVQLESGSDKTQATLERILERNKASAPAYILFAKLFQKRGLREEARRKFGAATIIDSNVRDPALEAWLEFGTQMPVAYVPSSPVIEEAVEEDEELSQLVDSILESIPEVEDPLLEAPIPKLTFSDIGGMTEVIERIRMNIIYPFKNPEVFKKFNKKPGGGILMYGPPGCGKTHIARATAGECGAAFISIGITDVLSKWLGESERHLHELFETARRRSPTVIFIDEIDALGGTRSDSSSHMSALVNVLLTEMDGISGKNENVMVLAATNTPWRVDDALRRPGRFDRVLFVPPPDAAAREAILKICLRNLPAAELDLAKIAKLTERFSGADLRAVVERAAERAIAEEMRTGKPTLLTQSMLTEAAKATRPSTGEWLETAKSYAAYANKSGLYDELAQFLEKY